MGAIIKAGKMGRLDIDSAIILLERGIVRYEVLEGICNRFLVYKRTAGSHRIYMADDSADIINIQPAKNGDAKRYQQNQVAQLLRKMYGE